MVSLRVYRYVHMQLQATCGRGKDGRLRTLLPYPVFNNGPVLSGAVQVLCYMICDLRSRGLQLPLVDRLVVRGTGRCTRQR